MSKFASTVFTVLLTVLLGVVLSSQCVTALAQSKFAVATAKPVLVTYGSTGPLVQDSPSLSPVWVDTHAKSFLLGMVWIYEDNTCRLYPGQQGALAIRAPLHGKVFFTQENLTNPPGSWCAGHTYPYWVARYTWTDAEETSLEDPLTLESTDVYQGYTSAASYNISAMFARVVATSVAATSTSNVQGTPQDVANSKLIDPPPGGASYTWTMTGGAGKLAFTNGAPSMTTTTSTVPIASLNGEGDTINLSVAVLGKAGANTLAYGPTPYTYPTIVAQAKNITPSLNLQSEQTKVSFFTPQTAHLTLGGTFQISIGKLAEDGTIQTISSSYALGSPTLSNNIDSAALFPNVAVFQYSNLANQAVVLQGVHIGTQTLTITPADNTILPVQLTLSVEEPDSLAAIMHEQPQTVWI